MIPLQSKVQPEAGANGDNGVEGGGDSDDDLDKPEAQPGLLGLHALIREALQTIEEKRGTT